MGTTAAIVGAVVGVAGGVQQHKSTKRVEKKREESDKLSLATQRVQAARARRQQMAQMREVQAQNVAASEAAGSGGSSAEAGALSGMSTQAGSNIGFANQLEGAMRGQFNIGQGINAASSKAQTAGQVSNLGFGVAKMGFAEAGGMKGMKEDLSKAGQKIKSFVQ